MTDKIAVNLTQQECGPCSVFPCYNLKCVTESSDAAAGMAKQTEDNTQNREAFHIL